MILKVSRARPLSRNKCKVVVPALIIRFSYVASKSWKINFSALK